MKKSNKNTDTHAIPPPPELSHALHTMECSNVYQATQKSLKENLDAIYNTVSSMPYSKASITPDYTSSCAPVGFGGVSPVTPCQFYPKLIVDGVDVVKMLTDIAVATGALRNATDVANLDVIQHYSAERLAHFIINDSKKIISGSGDAVAELTEWLKSKAE